MASRSRRGPAKAAAGALTLTVDWFGETHEVRFAEHQLAAPLPWVDLRVLEGEAYLWRPPAKARLRRAEPVLGVPAEMLERVLGELELSGPRWIALLPPAGMRCEGETAQEAIDALAAALARLVPGGDA
jgi:hypothetical protein